MLVDGRGGLCHIISRHAVRQEMWFLATTESVAQSIEAQQAWDDRGLVTAECCW